MNERRSEPKSDGASEVLAVYMVLAAKWSNLHHWLAKRSDEVRFLRLKPQAGEWIAILGIYGDDGTPLVAFGRGELYTDALRSLNSSISAGKWQQDKFA